MLRKEHIPIVVVVGIILALSFAVWAVKSLGVKPEAALMKAALENNVDILETRLNAGADVNTRTGDGWTALMYAACGDSAEATQYLLKEGAELNLRNNDDKTALTLAKEKQNPDIVRLLQEAGGIE
jgi:ankyrin repeat protein